MSSPETDTSGQCNVCGGERFGPGPMGRRSSTGKLPHCVHCGALERHRALRAVFDGLPLGLLYRVNALVFSRDPALEPRWFHSFERSLYGEENSLDLQRIERVDGLYDLISLNHVLEFVPDARAAFRELTRICSLGGFIQVGFAGTEHRAACLDFTEPHGVQGCFHLFGADLPTYFGLADLGMRCCVMVGHDTVTGVSEPFHFFTRNAGVLGTLEAGGGTELIG